MNSNQAVGTFLIGITLLTLLMSTFNADISKWIYSNVGEFGLCVTGFAGIIMLIPNSKGNKDKG